MAERNRDSSDDLDQRSVGKFAELEYRIRRLERVFELVHRKIKSSNDICNLVIYTQEELEMIESDITRELHERYGTKSISICPPSPRDVKHE